MTNFDQDSDSNNSTLDVGARASESVVKSFRRIALMLVKIIKEVAVKIIKIIATAVMKVISLLPIWLIMIILVTILVFIFVPSTDIAEVNAENVEMKVAENEELQKIREFAEQHRIKIQNIIESTPHDKLILPTGYGIPHLLVLYMESYYLNDEGRIDESKISIDVKVEEQSIEQEDGLINTYRTLIITINVDYNPEIEGSIIGDMDALEESIYLVAGVKPVDNTPIYGNNSIEARFWNFFLERGYTKEAISAMMGNIYMESGFNTDAIEQTTTNPGEGVGLVQWSFGRKKALMRFAEMRGVSWQDLQVQLEYLDYELNYSQANRFYSRALPYPAPHNYLGYSNGIVGFKNDSNLENATMIFCFNFETPNYSYAGLNSRILKAREYYNQFKDGFTEGFIYPVPGYTYISSYYGNRTFMLNGSPYSDFHTGIDFPAPQGTPVIATASGIVTLASMQEVSGNTIIIDHGNGMTSLSCHLSGYNCSVGRSINAGDTIGYVGQTGFATGAHLHFEIRINNELVDPLTLIQ